MRRSHVRGDQPVTDSAFIVEAFALIGNLTIGPYSDTMKAGGLILVSGRIGLNSTNMLLVEGG
jgi:enamine deaminase RidA (YjgF/YER057c/UK114 family)